MVIGPPLSARTDSTSVSLIQALLDGTAASKGYGGPIAFPWVDVRDVAEAHFRAAENPKASGRYLLGSARGYSQFEIAQMLINSGKFSKYSIPTKEATAIVKRILIDNSKATKELGIEFTPVEKSVVDMADALVELGIVKKIE